MGGKAGKILPLVAMAVATYFTAGAALGAGAAAGTAGGAAGAGAAGGSVFTMAGATATEAALTQGLVASGIGAPMSMTGLGMTAFEKASLALGAAGLVSGISGAAANAQTQRQALAIQAEEQRVKMLGDRLAITQREAEVQKNLRRTLAAQTVAFNARGIDPGSGSPFALQEGARRGAEDDLDMLAPSGKSPGSAAN